MEKLPSSGAKDGKGLLMKRPSLWTGRSSSQNALSLEISHWVLSSAQASRQFWHLLTLSTNQKGEAQKSEAIGLNS